MSTFTSWLVLVALLVASLVFGSPRSVLAQDRGPAAEAAEGTTIGSAQVSGLSFDALSPGLRLAINALAGESLCLYFGYRPVEPSTFEFSERICKAFFKRHIAEGIFERAQILGGMMPLPNGPLHPDVSRQVRRSVAASSELCALVESFVYF